MTEAEFWTLIDETREATKGNVPGQVLLMEERLLEGGKEQEVLDFAQHLQDKLASSYTGYLWGVCYLINWDESPEIFEAFRAWLILKGEKNFLAVQQNGDVMVDLIDEREVDQDFSVQAAELLALPFAVWTEITGNDPEEMPLNREPVDLVGDVWEKDEDLESEYPLLFELVGWEENEDGDSQVSI